MEQMPSPIVKKCLLKDSPVAGLFFDAENTGWNAGMGFERMKKLPVLHRQPLTVIHISKVYRLVKTHS